MRLVADEFRAARFASGLSQRAVAEAVKISRPAYGRIERAELHTLGVVVAARIAAVLGLDLYVALYPGSRGLRDEPSAKMIKRVLDAAAPPLRCQTDAPLPRRSDTNEQRAWDLVTTGHGERTAYEFESRLHDVQAILRRHNLKRRDDPTDRFVLVLADTHRNRSELQEYADLFTDLPRIGTADFLSALKAGRHPPTGLVLFSPQPRLPKGRPTRDASAEEPDLDDALEDAQPVEDAG